MRTHAYSAFEGISLAPWAWKEPRCQHLCASCRFLLLLCDPLCPHPVSLLRPGWPVQPIRNLLYILLGDITCATGCGTAPWQPVTKPGQRQFQLPLWAAALAAVAAGLDWERSLILIYLHSQPLATSSLPLSFLFPLLSLLLFVWCWDMIWWEQRGVRYIDSASTAVSLALFIPVSSALISFHLSPRYLFLSTSFLSLQRAIIITPLLDAQAINQGLPSSYTYISLGEDKTNKGLA